MVKGNYARGHWQRARDEAGADLPPLPPPDDDDDDPDADIDAGDFDPGDDDDQLPDWLSPTGRVGPPGDDDEPAQPDPPPGHTARDKRRHRAARTPPAAPVVRVTAAVRKDVRAKIGIITMPCAQYAAMRDPVCGGVAVAQEPAIADALAVLVCDSPDLLAWFTGPAGGFMKYLDLFMACLPVLLIVRAHHLTRDPDMTRQMGNPVQPQQQPAYAA